MKTLPKIDTEFMLSFLQNLLNTPSPTGFTEDAVNSVGKVLEDFPDVKLARTRKGGLVGTVAGVRDNAPHGLTAHIDTLGAMVKEIKPNGRIKLTKIGGFPWNTVEGEGCTVHLNDGKKIRGSILLSQASVHVYGSKVSENKRDDDNMEVRLDEVTSSADETQELGIQVGDFVAIDPRVEVRNGFVRSRHLDDKACVANIISAIKRSMMPVSSLRRPPQS